MDTCSLCIVLSTYLHSFLWDHTPPSHLGPPKIHTSITWKHERKMWNKANRHVFMSCYIHLASFDIQIFWRVHYFKWPLKPLHSLCSLSEKRGMSNYCLCLWYLNRYTKRLSTDGWAVRESGYSSEGCRFDFRPCQMKLCPWARQFTLLASGECLLND